MQGGGSYIVVDLRYNKFKGSRIESSHQTLSILILCPQYSTIRVLYYFDYLIPLRTHNIIVHSPSVFLSLVVLFI